MQQNDGADRAHRRLPRDRWIEGDGLNSDAFVFPFDFGHVRSVAVSGPLFNFCNESAPVIQSNVRSSETFESLLMVLIVSAGTARFRQLSGAFRKTHFLLGYDKAKRKVRIAQLVQIGTIASALKAHNITAIVQVELIGYSKEALWRPDPEVVKVLASLMAACEVEYGIPLSHPWPDNEWGRAGPNPHRKSGVQLPDGLAIKMRLVLIAIGTLVPSNGPIY